MKEQLQDFWDDHKGSIAVKGAIFCAGVAVSALIAVKLGRPSVKMET